MIIFKKADELSDYLGLQKNDGKKIGFVPTMGALHQGHIKLIQLSKQTNDICVASIFINPTQFNNPEDFKLYPVTIESDIEQLVTAHCDVLFLPPLSEIYPLGYLPKHYELGNLEFILEGKYRPGHFQGVCNVVDRLLEIVSPHQLYLGQKDFQQCMVIRKLLQLLDKADEITLKIIPTIRENDGLAMSSRNLRLNETQRKIAPAIFSELTTIKENIGKKSLEDLKKTACDGLRQKGFIVDYIEIVKVHDLSNAEGITSPLVALSAASIGNVRLIDNMLLN